jgi:N-acetylmuramoyl-L-alanine amidase
MAPEPASYLQLPADGAHHGPARPMPPRMIVMHATAGTDSAAWLSTTSQPPVSSHVLIKKTGQVIRIVQDDQVAWHAGVSKLYPYGGTGQPSINAVSLGVELENLDTIGDSYPVVQTQAAAAVCYRWWKQYGAIPIVTHAQIAPLRKKDPQFFPWAVFWDHLYSLIRSNAPVV